MTPRGLLPWLISLLVHAALLLLPVGLLLAPVGGQGKPSVEITFNTARSQQVGTGAAVIGRGAARVDPGAPAQAPGSPAFRTVPTLTGRSSTEDPSSETSSTTAGGSAGWPVGTPVDGGVGQDMTGTNIRLTGAPRTVIRGILPVFPPMLSAAGQEVDGEARITVSPSGAVVRVEITRSTDYIEIDNSVVAALLDYLFSPVDSREDAQGTVRFRFRLEKTD